MKLYHVSPDPNLKVLIPRVPKNGVVNWGAEDGVHKRVCFAPSIQQALRAMARPVNKETLYVYTPVGLNNRWIYKPTSTQVPDVGVTNEIWYLRPCQVKLVEVIVGGRRLGKEAVLIELNNERRKKFMELYHPRINLNEYDYFSVPSYSNIKYKSIRRTKQAEAEYDPKAGRITLFFSKFVNRDDMPIF
jgi:hypothetical protein